MALSIESGTPKKLLNPVTVRAASHQRELENMKASIRRIENEASHRQARQLPMIDVHYQTISPGRSGGFCVGLASPSFRSISRAYFDNEANQHFLAEAAVCAAIMLTAAVP